MEKENLLLFKLDDKTAAFKTIAVREILRNVELKILPSQPEFISGVMNMRGEAIPVIDLKKRFMIGDKSDDLSSRIILTMLNNSELIGFRVDEVIGLKDLEINDDLEPHLEKLYIKSHFINSISFNEDVMVVIIDENEIFNEIESELLESISQDNG